MTSTSTSGSGDEGSGAEPITPESLERSRADALAPYEAGDTIRDVPTRVSHNIRWNLVGQFWAFAITIIATPITIRRLGTDAYGVIAALAVVTNYMAFLDLGVSQASIKYIAEYRAQRRWSDVRLVFWTALTLYVGLALLAAGLVLALAPSATFRWFRIPSDLQSEALAAFWVGAVGVFFVLLNFGPSSLIRGFERFDVVNKVGIVVGTAQPVLTLALVLAGFRLPAIVAGSVLILGGAVLWNFSVVRRLFPALGRPAWDRVMLGRLVRFGSYLAAASVLAPLAVSAEKFLLAGSVSIAALTFYMVPQSVVSRLAIIPASFSSALFPTFTALHTSGDRTRNAALNVQVARTLVYVFAPILVVTLLFGDLLLRLWMGADFAAQSGIVLRILVIAAFIQALAWTPHVLIQALGRSDITFRVYLIQVVLYLPLAYAAVRNWGLNGAAIAWTVRVVLDSALVWYYATALGGGSLVAVLREVRVLLALAALAVLAVTTFVSEGIGVVPAAVGGAAGLVALVAVARPAMETVRRIAAGELAQVWEAA